VGSLPCILLIVHSRVGWQVGSDPEIQVASVTTNHLKAGLLKYFGTSGRYQQAANLFEKIVVREPEVSSLLARAYLGMRTWSNGSCGPTLTSPSQTRK
jgi:hypothetical protein